MNGNEKLSKEKEAEKWKLIVLAQAHKRKIAQIKFKKSANLGMKKSEEEKDFRHVFEEVETQKKNFTPWLLTKQRFRVKLKNAVDARKWRKARSYYLGITCCFFRAWIRSKTRFNVIRNSTKMRLCFVGNFLFLILVLVMERQKKWKQLKRFWCFLWRFVDIVITTRSGSEFCKQLIKEFVSISGVKVELVKDTCCDYARGDERNVGSAIGMLMLIIVLKSVARWIRQFDLK